MKGANKNPYETKNLCNKCVLGLLKILVHLVVKYVKHVDDVPVCLYDINLLSL